MRPGRISAETSPDDLTERWLALGEIASVALTFSLLIWVVLPLSNYDKRLAALFAPIAFLYMFASHRARHETAQAIGFRTDNLARALRLVALFAAGAAPLLVLLGWSLRKYGVSSDVDRWGEGWANGEFSLTETLWRGTRLFSGLAQQYVLHGFINRRAQLVWGKGVASVLLVASVFALWHLPNYWLMLATFIAGAAWAMIYQREPNLYALGISHALSSWLLLSSIPSSVFNNLRVGLRYFE